MKYQLCSPGISRTFTALAQNQRWQYNSKILLQPKFYPNRTIGSRDTAFWTTFLALALGPLVQFQKNFLWTIYLLWRGIGPNISLLGPILWEELRCKGILDHIFGPSSGSLGPIPKKILRDNLPNMAGQWSNFQPSRSKNVGGVALKRNKMACII